jgi:uncharacterized LabA/DUF88 family protein
MPVSPRTVWLFDGFNLHHSLRQCQADHDKSLLWIDPVRLASQHLHVIGGGCELGEVHYFSAIPHHWAEVDPDAFANQTLHIRALSALRPRCAVHLGHFQSRKVDGARVWQEKGTDMAIAAMAIRACQDHPRLALVIVSGDSDFVPLALLISERWPDVDLRFAFPAHRASRRLRQLCPRSFTLGPSSYASARLPNRVRLPSGKYVECPDEWRDDRSGEVHETCRNYSSKTTSQESRSCLG